MITKIPDVKQQFGYMFHVPGTLTRMSNVLCHCAETDFLDYSETHFMAKQRKIDSSNMRNMNARVQTLNSHPMSG